MNGLNHDEVARIWAASLDPPDFADPAHSHVGGGELREDVSPPRSASHPPYEEEGLVTSCPSPTHAAGRTTMFRSPTPSRGSERGVSANDAGSPSRRPLPETVMNAASALASNVSTLSAEDTARVVRSAEHRDTLVGEFEVFLRDELARHWSTQGDGDVIRTQLGHLRAALGMSGEMPSSKVDAIACCTTAATALRDDVDSLVNRVVELEELLDDVVRSRDTHAACLATVLTGQSPISLPQHDGGSTKASPRGARTPRTPLVTPRKIEHTQLQKQVDEFDRHMREVARCIGISPTVPALAEFLREHDFKDLLHHNEATARELDATVEQLQHYRLQCDDLDDKYRDAIDDVDRLTQENTNLVEELKASQQQVDTYFDELTMALQNLEQLETDYAIQQDEISRLHKNHASITKEYHELQTHLDIASQKLKHTNSTVHTTQHDLGRTRSNLTDTRKQLESLRTELHTAQSDATST
eukprot:PhM_4_TR11031/c0_g2_i1/m.31478